MLKNPGEDSSQLGLHKESIPGPIAFGHIRKWMFQMEVLKFQKEEEELGIPPVEVQWSYPARI